MPSKLNAWKPARRVGNQIESVVREALNEAGHDFIKNNVENVKDVDLASAANKNTIDIKACLSPYYSEEPDRLTPAGLTSKEHLTLDVANLEKYDDGVYIVFAVYYPFTKGIYIISAGKCKTIMNENPKRVYKRSKRSSSDKLVKIGISTKDCFELDVAAEYMDRIKLIVEGET